MTEALQQEIRTLKNVFESERDPEGRAFAPLADAYRRAGEVQEAVRLLSDGLARHPQFVPGHVVAAQLYVEQGLTEEAAIAARHALELDGENVNALRSLLTVLEQKEDAEAGEVRDRLVALDPGFASEAETASAAAAAVETAVPPPLPSQPPPLPSDVAASADEDDTLADELQSFGAVPPVLDFAPSDIEEADEPTSDAAFDAEVAGPGLEDAPGAPGDEPLIDLDSISFDLELGVPGLGELEETVGVPDEDLELVAMDLSVEEPVVDLEDLAPVGSDDDADSLGELPPPAGELPDLAPEDYEEPVMELADLGPPAEADEPVVELDALAPDEPVMELDALAPDEPVMDLDALAPDEPVMDLEALAPDEPVVELDALAPDEPVMELDALAPDEPVVELDALAPDEPVMELDALAPDEPVMELEALAPDEPVMELDALAPDEPVMDLDALAPDESVMELDALAPDEPVVELADLAPGAEAASAASEGDAEVTMVVLVDQTTSHDAGEAEGRAAASESGDGSEEDDDDHTPGEPVYTRTLAELYVKQGAIGQALEVYRHLSELSPGDEEIVRRIEELESGAALEEGVEGALPEGAEAEGALPDEEEAEEEEEVETLARELAESRPGEHDELESPFTLDSASGEAAPSDDAESGPTIDEYFEGLLTWKRGKRS